MHMLLAGKNKTNLISYSILYSGMVSVTAYCSNLNGNGKKDI